MIYIIDTLRLNYAEYSINFGASYIFGAFLVTFLQRHQKTSLLLVVLVAIPIFVSVLLIVDRHFQYYFANLLIIGGLLCNYGMLQVLVIKLTVVNSNRPEFFVGMFYFLSSFTCALLYNLHT